VKKPKWHRVCPIICGAELPDGNRCGRVLGDVLRPPFNRSILRVDVRIATRWDEQPLGPTANRRIDAFVVDSFHFAGPRLPSDPHPNMPDPLELWCEGGGHGRRIVSREMLAATIRRSRFGQVKLFTETPTTVRYTDGSS
jgi:hypothetical protein